ncbi:MAG: LEA type 2 family protein [Candidatus Margulisbacteria bacterium]|nr:LEA type 2 family protein [Candidatus Margulisiibacteriota bacterium]
MKKLILIPVLFLISFILTSCVEPKAPTAEYLNYEISRVTLEGIEVNFNFDVSNPNPLPVDVSKYAYKVYINNNEFLSENRPGFNLPANNKKRIVIPVSIRYDRLFGSAAAVLQQMAQGTDKIDYRIEGSVSAGAMGVTVGTPIKASGTIPLPKNIKITQ